MANTFYPDIAKYQHVVTSAMPYPILAFRADSGFETDSNAQANWNYCVSTPSIRVAIAYVVFIPGASGQILTRIQTLFGATAPKKLVVMVDMESGGQFAGPGNHSVEADSFVNRLMNWVGSPKRVIGYANKYDWKDNWPQAPAGMRRVTAAYSASDPGTFGWQYYGGVQNPHPAGYPTTCAPFGSSVDMNVIHESIDNIVAIFDIEEEDEMQPADWTRLQQMLDSHRTEVKADVTALLAEGVNVRNLLAWDHKTWGSAESFLSGIEGGDYTPYASRAKK